MTETTAERREAWRAPLPGIWALVLMAAVAMAVALAFFISMSVAALALVGAGTGLVAMGVVFWLYKGLRGLRQRAWLGTVRDLVTSDPWPSVLTNANGRIIHANEAVTQMLGAGRGQILSDVLAEEMVAADALVERLLASTTDRSHSALETVHVDRADIAVSAQRLADSVVLWRMKITTLDAEAFDGALSLPVVSGSPLTGWLPRNAPARAALNDAPPRVSTGPPEIAGHVATPLMQSADVETVIYLPKHRATLAGEASAAVEDIATLDSLIAGLPVPFVRIETEGKVAAANAPARRLLGLDAGEVPPLYQIVEGLGRSVNDWLKDATEARGLLKPEFVRATLPEADTYIQIMLGRIENDTGTHLIGILNDATELKTMEANFVQSQKMQAIGQLAGGVAHDFNNLLTAISGHCDLLLLRHDQSAPDYSDLKQIAHNANRAASLVGQLLAFSRKQTLMAQPMDLHETMSDLTHLLNRLVGEKVTLSLDIAPIDKVIWADRRQFEQVIVNLVVNARDAMPDGGPIEIRVETQWVDAEFTRDRAIVSAGDYVVVKVRDEGHGIDPEKLPKIFEPFFTTKRTGEGTGLGLSTAYGIVKQSGGFIFADSEIGRGTCFTLMFPAHAREAVVEPPIPLPRKPQATSPQHGVVLLVEDETPVRAFASRALRLRGYTVLEAEDAESALRILEDRSLQIDVFVTDVIMPGLDGPTWVRQALEDRPQTRVVFVSGYSQENLAENQARVPNSVFLAKPFSLTELTEVVQEQMS